MSDTSYLTDVKFNSLPLSKESLGALTQKMKFTCMTQVQHLTFNLILEGNDVLAKAKTGTGKTVAFLLPSVENLIKTSSKVVDGNIDILVISPTRELAFQISEEAKNLVSLHCLKVVCVVGGTNIKSDITSLYGKVHVLVGTPGRLIDHIQNHGLNQRLSNLKVLVLDECDRLLDMGFRPDIEKIIRSVNKNRQTLLFSATTPASMNKFKCIALKENHSVVNTMGDDEEQTNCQTEHFVTVAPLEKQIEVLAYLLSTHIKKVDQYKIIVFFTTARGAGYMAELFTAAGFTVVEMHSRKNQNQRTKAADIFRTGNRVIMFSSDVSARGVDYPDVTLVVQVGLTDREQYIHRIGRTGRAGCSGQGILLAFPDEEITMMNTFLKEFAPTKISITDQDLENDSGATALRQTLNYIRSTKSLRKSGHQAYQAWLGFYNSNLRKLKWTKIKLVEMANFYSSTIGLPEPPNIAKKIVSKMGLKGIPGLKIGGGFGH